MEHKFEDFEIEEDNYENEDIKSVEERKFKNINTLFEELSNGLLENTMKYINESNDINEKSKNGDTLLIIASNMVILK